MTRPRESGRPWWRLLAAVLIGAAGILLSVAAWSALASSDRHEIESRLETTASELARSLESISSQQIEQLRELGLTWGRLGTEDASRWDADATLFRQLHEECIALEWVSRTPQSEPLISGTAEGQSLLASRRADAAAEKAREANAEGKTEACLGPWPAPDGRQVLEIMIPVPVAEDQVMVLTALVDPAVSLDHVVGPWLEEYVVEISAAGVPLFRRDESARGELSRLSEERSFRPVGQGPEWTLSVRPGRKLLAAPQRVLQWVVLIGGIVLSALIASTFWVGQVALLRARDLFGVTVELQEQRRALQRVRRDRQALTVGMMSMKMEMESRSSSGHPDPAVSELETFTYSVSHDLRSPMGAILNYAAVLAEDYRDAFGPEGREYLQRITASAQKAIAMMDGLLAFSRVGSQALKVADVDVSDLVREIHAELSQSRPERKPALSMGALPPVRGDRTLLWTLFSNLLSNAFKFTHGVDDPRIEVGGYVQGDDVVYYVKDNGIGFDMRHADKLFGVFQRLPTGEPHEGYGIGLAVVERIVRRHGGSVRAEGVPGKGATFFVTLPSDPLHEDPGVAAETSLTP